jgi:hypothetical protein
MRTKRLITPEEVEKLQIRMLKRKLNEKALAKSLGYKFSDYRNIILRNKTESDDRIKTIIERAETMDIFV